LISPRGGDYYVEEGVIRPDGWVDEVEIADSGGGNGRAPRVTVVVRATASVPCRIHWSAVDVNREYSDLFLAPIANKNRNVPTLWIEVYVLDRETFLYSSSLLLKVRPLAVAIAAIAIIGPSHQAGSYGERD